MSRKLLIFGFGSVLFTTTIGNSQQTQTGPPANPTSSVYNRMRRVSPQTTSPQDQQTQAQQFPSAAQQFPPEQQDTPTQGQRPPTIFPHPPAPDQEQPIPQPSQQGIVPQNSQPQAPAQQSEYGVALKPANPPRISYAGGVLAVTADNSSLADIVAGIQRAIGARVEGTRPDGERVFGQFGPGTPRDVLNSLFTGSHYDFILAGAIDDPGGVQRIMLSPHGASAPGNTTTAGNQQPQRPNFPTPAADDDDNEGFVTPQPVEVQQAPNQTNVPSEQSQPGQQQVKTPEQLLQELQRLRQQQQQQQPTPQVNPR